MATITEVFAKLAGLDKVVRNALQGDAPSERLWNQWQLFDRYNAYLTQLKTLLPDLFGELAPLELPPTMTLEYLHGRFCDLRDELGFIFEVRAHSNPGAPPAAILSREATAFISHGRSHLWREVQSYVERDLGIKTLELAQEPNLGRTVLQKLEDESNRCSYAIVVMTGDDKIEADVRRARENVMHEIGYFQGKYGLKNVCLLYEEGTSIPSNIHGLVYIPFPEGLVSASLGALTRELRAAFRTVDQEDR